MELARRAELKMPAARGNVPRMHAREGSGQDCGNRAISPPPWLPCNRWGMRFAPKWSPLRPTAEEPQRLAAGVLGSYGGDIFVGVVGVGGRAAADGEFLLLVMMLLLKMTM